MEELLTVSEMKSRYPGEWVLVENPITDKSHEVLSGNVRYHSRDRDDFDRMALELRPQHTAVIYFGDVLPAGMEAILYERPVRSARQVGGRGSEDLGSAR